MTMPAFPLEPHTLATAEAILVPCAINLEAGSNLEAVLELARVAAATPSRRFPGAPHVRSVILDLRHVAHVTEQAYAMMHEIRRQCGLLDMEVFALPPEQGSPIVRLWRAINGWFFPAPPPSLQSRAVTLAASPQPEQGGVN
jgi:hypothetical protein